MNLVANKITSRDETTYNIAYLAFIYILMLSTAAWGIFTFFADEPRKMQIAVFLIFIFIYLILSIIGCFIGNKIKNS